jgi:hypothetical protein
VLHLNPRGLIPERARVTRWLDQRVASMRRSEAAMQVEKARRREVEA